MNGDRSNCIHFNIKLVRCRISLSPSLKPTEFKIPVSENFVLCQDNNLKLIKTYACSYMHMLQYFVHVYLTGKKSRQWSGNGTIIKKFPLQKPRREKTKSTLMHLYGENIS